MTSVALWLPEAGFWNDITTAPMLGGREFAAVKIAEALAALGVEVTIYAQGVNRHAIRNDVHYLPPHAPVLGRPITSHLYDAVVAIGDYDILQDARAARRIAWMQTGIVSFGSLSNDFITRYVVNSPAKKAILLSWSPSVAPDNVSVIGNGVTLSDYDECDAMPVEGRLLWSQSPDRGLYHLLRMWPRIKERHPHATLHVTYRIDDMRTSHWRRDRWAEIARIVDQGASLPGVAYLGVVSRERLVREQKEAALWAFTCDFANQGETFSIGAMEMCAARVPMILSDDLSLLEMYGGVARILPLPIDDDAWVAAIDEHLAHPPNRDLITRAGRELAERYTWANLAKEWLAVVGVPTRQEAAV